MSKRNPVLAEQQRKALAKFKVLYPECTDGYIKIAFVTGWLESHVETTKAKP